jgi:hypothetical protein
VLAGRLADGLDPQYEVATHLRSSCESCPSGAPWEETGA